MRKMRLLSTVLIIFCFYLAANDQENENPSNEAQDSYLIAFFNTRRFNSSLSLTPSSI